MHDNNNYELERNPINVDLTVMLYNFMNESNCINLSIIGNTHVGITCIGMVCDAQATGLLWLSKKLQCDLTSGEIF